MKHFSKILLVVSVVLLFSLVPYICQAQKQGEIGYVVLITIDGFRGDMVSNVEYPAPVLKSLLKRGLFFENITGVAPSSTYPAHTTIVTGERPINHGIFYNYPFTAKSKMGIANWYYDSIRIPTIWEYAKKNGLKTASIFWPVTTGSKYIDINIPEFWSSQKVEDQVEYISDYCTPRGIFEEVEKEATGKLYTKNFNPSKRNREGRTGYMAAYIIEKYKPQLFTIHFISTDYYQHKYGTKSDEVKMALSAIDYGIGQVIEGLERADILDKTLLIISGDHGFVDAHKAVAPNVWLRECGLYSEDPNNWRVMLHQSGATMFLYQRDSMDLEAVNIFMNKIESLPSDVKTLFRVVKKNELIDLGCDPKVVLALEPINGVTMVDNNVGDSVFQIFGGKHGYLSAIDNTAFILYYGSENKRDAFYKEIDKRRYSNLTDIFKVVVYSLNLKL